MNAYSEDLRRKIVDAVERGMLKSEVAHLFGVSLSSVKRYAKMAREGRPLSARKAPGKCPKIDERARRLLKADLEEHPAATLAQRSWFLERVARVRVSRSTVSRMLKRFLRHIGARTREVLVEATGKALDAVTAVNALGFFTHCGYRTLEQRLSNAL